MRKIYLILLITIFPIISFAQEVKGTIVDEIGTPLPGVTIHNLKLDKYATSDFDGNFILQANSGDDIKFTMIGMSDLTLKATSEMKVTMKESTTEFKEVVMIGYGTAKKRDLTGSIVKISGSEVSDKPNTNPMASMQGKVAGLSVVNSGVPGSEPDIRIRGTVSLFQTKPLYVIDGIFNDNMSYINPNDIESIEVLKDPSSLAVFGAKGANGVIIVSTKRAKSGKTTINFNTSLGVKNIVNKPELTNASQFKSLYDMQRANQGASAYPYYNLYTADTDWVNEISNDNAVISMQNLSISNATEKNKIYLGVGYVNEEGLIKNELYKKFTFNLNDELII
jgi:TonB-dependent SusC/RagA subfamily outer membrane receptor